MAFCGCERLCSVRFGEKLEILGPACLMGTGVAELGLPGSLRKARNAFYGCAGLKRVLVPAGRLEVVPEADGTFSATLYASGRQEELVSHVVFSTLHLREVVFADGRREAWEGSAGEPEAKGE